MLRFGLFATDQSHEENLSLCASDSVKLFIPTLLVHRVVHLEQVYTILMDPILQKIPTLAQIDTCLSKTLAVEIAISKSEELRLTVSQ